MDMSGMDMSGMDMHNSSSSMDASHMNMVFFSSTTTPLYGATWSPTSFGSYIGTCFFLVALAITFRALFAAGYLLDKHNIDVARKRRYIVVAGRPSIAEQTALNPATKEAVLISEQGSEESVRVVSKKIRTVMPWRLSTDLPRSILSTIIAGIGYLLMLAVMTLNVGYFCSVLAGTFVGELAFGRFTRMDEH